LASVYLSMALYGFVWFFDVLGWFCRQPPNPQKPTFFVFMVCMFFWLGATTKT